MITMLDIIKYQEIKEKIESSTLNIYTAYKIAKFHKDIEEELNFYQETIKSYIDLYGERDSNNQIVLNGDLCSIKPECYKECQKKIEELNNLPLKISSPNFTLTELKDLELSVNDISILLPFIKNEDTHEKIREE